MTMPHFIRPRRVRLPGIPVHARVWRTVLLKRNSRFAVQAFQPNSDPSTRPTRLISRTNTSTHSAATHCYNSRERRYDYPITELCRQQIQSQGAAPLDERRVRSPLLRDLQESQEPRCPRGLSEAEVTLRDETRATSTALVFSMSRAVNTVLH